MEKVGRIETFKRTEREGEPKRKPEREEENRKEVSGNGGSEDIGITAKRKKTTRV